MDVAARAAARAVWARGDYPKVADDLISGLGPVLVQACGIGPGQRVLDIGAGSGNAAIPAAETGATVVACDLTPGLLTAGRRRAASRGVELAWAEADAEALPFADDEFDVVISCIGVMFAPDHQRAASELVRVCRPEGTVGLLSWTPDGTIGRLFATFAPYVASAAQPPALWGSAAYVRELFAERVQWTQMREEALPCAHFAHPRDLCEYYKQHFGPTIAAYDAVRDDPQRLAALDRDFLQFARGANRNTLGPAVYEYEYLLACGRTRSLRARRPGQRLSARR
jgi:ubiquinone/menaquinone biosynthesis C-methylase UbiE